MSQTLLRIKSLTALGVDVTVKPQDILVCMFNFRRSFSVFFHHNYLPSLVTIARWKGVPCTHGGGGAGSPFTLAPVSREFTCSHFQKKWMPRSSPTRGGWVSDLLTPCGCPCICHEPLKCSFRIRVSECNSFLNYYTLFPELMKILIHVMLRMDNCFLYIS